MTSQKFKIPQDGPIYIASIIERCEDLIYHGIWNGIHITRFRGWLSNFTTEEERYFAACILDFLIFRSEDQTVAMLKQLLQRILPDLHRNNPMPLSGFINFENRLIVRPDNREPGIRLVTVLRRSDPHSKSSPTIARLLKRRLSIDEDYIIKPKQIKKYITKRVKVFIFIDDFLGTGDQINKFINEENLEPLFKTCYFAYTPLTAHCKGIDKLNKTHPNLRVSAVEILDKSHSLFQDICSCFDDSLNNPSCAESFYSYLIRKKNLNIYRSQRRGWGNLQLAYAFSHAVPNNCLPILWWSKDSWRPLFDR
jgi:hypothetical protein